MPDAHAVLERLRSLNPAAGRIPGLALTHFLRAFTDDPEHVPYIDMTITAVGQQPRVVVVAGELVALTGAGVLIEVSYKGEDEIGPVRIRPLRGHVTGIELAYDENSVERGRILEQSVTVTLDNGDTLGLPLTLRRADGAVFLDGVLSALIG